MEEALCLLFLCVSVLERVCVQRAPDDYSGFPCAKHSDEPPPKQEVVFARGLHASGSFISIAQKETFHNRRELAGIYAF